ncbi:MAG: hypothetical protein ACREEE_04950, partial [Dongiaceae bacterium]
VGRIHRGVLDSLVLGCMTPRQVEYVAQAIHPKDGEVSNKDFADIFDDLTTTFGANRVGRKYEDSAWITLLDDRAK